MTTLMRRGFASTLLGSAALFFVGCGGGGSGPNPNPTATPVGTPNGTQTATPVGTPINTVTPGEAPVGVGDTVFVSNRANPSSSNTDIYKLRANGTVVRLTNLNKIIDKPSVSSDGERIVFQFEDPYTTVNGSADSDTEIGLVRTDGGNLGNGLPFQQLTKDTEDRFVNGRPDDYNPVFSPTDQYIYWTSTRQNAPHIWRMDGFVGNVGGGQGTAPFIAQVSAYPSVASNGDLAYVDYSVQGSPIAIRSTNGTVKRIRVDNVVNTQADPRIFDLGISPDSKRIAFSASTLTGSTTSASLRIYNVDTLAPEASTPAGAIGYSGSAWRDSNTLFFDAVAGTRQIFSTSATTSPAFSTQTPLVIGTGDNYSPAFLPFR